MRDGTLKPRPSGRGAVTTFTKGPWHVDGLVVSSANHEVCWMGVPAQFPGDVPDVCVNADNNAYLIAASPELLEALEAMVNLWVRLADSGDAGNWDPEEDEEIIQARAALAKARGVKEG